MEKRVSFIVLLFALAISLQAQDTLSADTIKSTYLCNQWPDFNRERLIMGNSNWGVDRRHVQAMLFEPGDDTITVYGMAVSAETFRPNQEIHNMCDTSAYEEAYEFWGLYKRVPALPNDSLKLISPQLPVNVKLDTPTYILAFSSFTDGSCTEHTRPLPVYELFFRTPQEVKGPFYMGITNRIFSMGDSCGKKYYTWPVLRRPITVDPSIDQGSAFYDEQSASWTFSRTILTFGFPIIAPPDSGYVWDTTIVAGDTVYTHGDTISMLSSDTIVANGDTVVVSNGDTVFVAGGSVIVPDTTIVLDTVVVLDTAIVGGDTIVYYDTIIHHDTIVVFDILLSIREVSLLQRLTGVTPNPATETAKVVSSFGISYIEAYDIAGQKVNELRFTSPSLSATLDVRRWPAGAYILRIHTPLGIAVKKLNVTR